jgi:hypothetical protein
MAQEDTMPAAVRSRVETGIDDALVDLAVAEGSLCEKRQLLRDYERTSALRYGSPDGWPPPTLSTAVGLRQVVDTLEQRVRATREYVESIEPLRR